MRPVEHYLHRFADAEGSNRYRQPDGGAADSGPLQQRLRFEHTFLAQQMGVDGRGQDLFVKDDYVYMRTTGDPQRVDVMLPAPRRRVSLDHSRSGPPVLGVPGLFNAYVKGNIGICNAIGTGVADDKSIYPYVPDMIKFYLDERTRS